MLLHMDGFDHYAPKTESAANIAVYLQAAGYTVTNAAQNNFALADGQDVASLGVKLTVIAGSNTPPSFQKTFNTTADKVVFGFSFRGTGSRQRVARVNGSVDVLWDVDTGKLKVGSTQGADVIILNAFWFIEIVVDKANSVFEVYANDTLQLTVPLPGGAVTNSHTIMWGNTGASVSAATVEIDDFYVVDSSGGSRNDRLGPVQAITRAPTTDVDVEWVAQGSSGTHASILAQLSPNTLNAPYVQANIEGKHDSFTSNTVLPNDNQIFGVQLVAYARKGDLDDRALGLTIATAEDNEVEVEVPLTTTFAYRTTVFEQAPGGVDWNQARVESSIFGITAR